MSAPPLLDPHHDGSPAYVVTPDGRPVVAPDVGDEVAVDVEVPRGRGIDRVVLRTVVDGEPEYRDAELVHRGPDLERWRAMLPMTARRQPYRFWLEGRGIAGWQTQTGFEQRDVADHTDHAIVAGPTAPAWVSDAVLYQIFPDRFARAGVSEAWPTWAEPAAWDEPVRTDHPASMRQLFGGDLPGIVERLEHLRDLGVTGIYLNPFFPAAENHRYCATSFAEVDPFLGGDAALDELTERCHAVGLRILGDLTLNHSGRDHAWFAAAQADADGAEAGFYHFIEHPDRYHAWAGVPSLPKFDLRSPELRRRLIDGPDGVARRYLDPPFELDGWRVDAANMAGRCGEVDVAHDVQRALRELAGADRYLLAEHCHDATDDLQGDGWHGTMDYAGFSRPAWSWLRDPVEAPRMLDPLPVVRRGGVEAVEAVRAFRAQRPWSTTLHSVTLLGSHDTARWASLAGDRARAHVGFVWLFTFPGVPSLLYGDELGLTGEGDDAARRPMPWDEPERWDLETLTLTRQLIALRRASPALRHGGLRWAAVTEDAIVYLREHPRERLLVQLTRRPQGSVDLPIRVSTSVEPLLGQDPVDAGADHLTLPASDGAVGRVWRLPPGTEVGVAP